ncbi:MAG: hypothetical protein VCC99_14285 [Alphaproteobacteria bacterium]
MIVNNLDLDSAVAEGIISREQAARLRDLSTRDPASLDASIDFSQDTRDEPFRLLRGFRDFFIAIGVGIFAVGLSAVGVNQIKDSTVSEAVIRIGDVSIFAILIALVLCVLGIALAEFITRKQRLSLSSLVVAVAFTFWSALLVGLIVKSLSVPATTGWAIVREFPTWLNIWGATAGAILGSTLFYWRFRLPFTLFLLGGLLFGLTALLIRYSLGSGWFEDYGRLMVGLWGLAIFAAAMWFDVKDRARTTRLSECAFWLHLLAAPMLVHAALLGDALGDLKPGFVIGLMVLLSIVALLIDRRALLVSGLGYLAYAIGDLVKESSVIGDHSFAFTALILGGFMLTLGLGWTPIRRRVLEALPFEALKSRLPIALG